MTPPIPQLNATAVSGIAGSISIAFWLAVFSPQILLNFQRQSADGLSLAFLIVWLAGDIFNVVGAVMQGVLPTMIILGLYYTFADIILLGQCLYYTHAKSRLRIRRNSSSLAISANADESDEDREITVDGSHLSPATPLLDPSKSDSEDGAPTSTLYSIVFNTSALLTVTLAGVIGWYLSQLSSLESDHGDHGGHVGEPEKEIQWSLWGQVFGYLCAVLYLASRVPQILLNYRRKSCEGVSILFFIFAGMGNLTYVMSILAYVPEGDWDPRKYRMHLAVNASWLLGSVGTLVLDAMIFAQFFLYQNAEDDEEDCESDFGVEDLEGIQQNEALHA